MKAPSSLQQQWQAEWDSLTPETVGNILDTTNSITDKAFSLIVNRSPNILKLYFASTFILYIFRFKHGPMMATPLVFLMHAVSEVLSSLSLLYLVSAYIVVIAHLSHDFKLTTDPFAKLKFSRIFLGFPTMFLPILPFTFLTNLSKLLPPLLILFSLFFILRSLFIKPFHCSTWQSFYDFFYKLILLMIYSLHQGKKQSNFSEFVTFLYILTTIIFVISTAYFCWELSFTIVSLLTLIIFLEHPNRIQNSFKSTLASYSLVKHYAPLLLATSIGLATRLIRKAFICSPFLLSFCVIFGHLVSNLLFHNNTPSPINRHIGIVCGELAADLFIFYYIAPLLISLLATVYTTIKNQQVLLESQPEENSEENLSVGYGAYLPAEDATIHIQNKENDFNENSKGEL